MNRTPGWRNEALCTTEDPELFFPLGEGRRAAEQAEVARGICLLCEVRRQCLQAALAMDAQYGVWGGTTPAERRIASLVASPRGLGARQPTNRASTPAV